MTSHETIGIVNELEIFWKELDDYSYYRLLEANKQATKKQVSDGEVLRDKLLRDSSRFTSLITELTGKETVGITTKGHVHSSDMWLRALRIKFDLNTVELLSYCVDVTKHAIGKLKDDIEKGYRDKQGNVIGKIPMVSQEPPKAFIAHEGMTRILQKLKDFLDALGINYLIAEEEPSDGRQVEGQVTRTYEKADFVIILATKGKAVNKKTGKPYMGLNVADELGRAREAKKRVILLLQKGVEPHTNIAGIVHERFIPQSMDKAFTKVVKELKNWDYIRVSI